MTSDKFVEHAHELRLFDFKFTQDKLLQFLKRKKMLIPETRMLYSNEQALKIYDNECFKWSMAHPNGSEKHPLETLKPAKKYKVTYDNKQLNVANKNFKISSKSIIEDYYSYWQVFKLAEILIPVYCPIIHIGKNTNLTEIKASDLYNYPRHLKYELIKWNSVLTLRKFLQWEPFFKLVAYFIDYKNFAYNKIALYRENPSKSITGKKLEQLEKMEKIAAYNAMKRWNKNSNELLKFIRWQFIQAESWDGRDRQIMVREYKRNIKESLELYCLYTGNDMQQVIENASKISKSFAKQLKNLYWLDKHKYIAISEFKNTMQSKNGTFYNLSDSDYTFYVNWIVKNNFFEFFWHLERIGDIDYIDDSINKKGFWRELVSYAGLLEHILNVILQEKHMFLSEKLQNVWKDIPSVAKQLKDNSKLTSVKKFNFITQLTKINKIKADDSDDLIKDLLTTMLIRNQAIHEGYFGFTMDELYNLHDVLLRTHIITWKHACDRDLVEFDKKEQLNKVTN